MVCKAAQLLSRFNMHAGDCNVVVENLADYLIDQS